MKFSEYMYVVYGTTPRGCYNKLKAFLASRSPPEKALGSFWS